MKRKLGIIQALMANAPVVILDEPTSGVDPIARRTFWDLIYELSAAGHTVFVSTHYMEEAEYCHRLAFMYKGAMIALDTPESLKSRLDVHSMEEVFVNLIDQGVNSERNL